MEKENSKTETIFYLRSIKEHGFPRVEKSYFAYMNGGPVGLIPFRNGYFRVSQTNGIHPKITHWLEEVPTSPNTSEGKYNANFLWGFEDNSIESIGYEFANAKTEEYQKECWESLKKEIHTRVVKEMEEEITKLKAEVNRLDRQAEERMEMESESYLSRQEIMASLKSENAKLREALELLVHLHLCEQEGLSSGQPSPKQWIEAVNKASEALNQKT